MQFHGIKPHLHAVRLGVFGNRSISREQSKLLVALRTFIKGFDDTFSQTVHARYSYRYDEIVWGTKFVPAFQIDPDGDIVLEVGRVGALAAAEALRA